jgi:hypothetical protein
MQYHPPILNINVTCRKPREPVTCRHALYIVRQYSLNVERPPWPHYVTSHAVLVHPAVNADTNVSQSSESHVAIKALHPHLLDV